MNNPDEKVILTRDIRTIRTYFIDNGLISEQDQFKFIHKYENFDIELGNTIVPISVLGINMKYPLDEVGKKYSFSKEKWAKYMYECIKHLVNNSDKHIIYRPYFFYVSNTGFLQHTGTPFKHNAYKIIETNFNSDRKLYSMRVKKL